MMNACEQQLVSRFNVSEAEQKKIEDTLLFAIYEEVINSSSPDFGEVTDMVLMNFKGKQRKLALVLMGQMIAETINGENQWIIDQLALVAFTRFGTTQISEDNFQECCEIVAKFSIERGLITVEEVI